MFSGSSPLIPSPKQSYLQLLLHDREGRRLLAFTVAFLILMAFSFPVALWAESLVLNLNGFILLHRVTSLSAILAGKIASSSNSRFGGGATTDGGGEVGKFSYGFLRLETIVRYASVAILIFSCLSCTVEGLQKVFQPHDVHPVSVEFVSLAHAALVAVLVNYTKTDQIMKAKRRGYKGLLMFYFTECLSPIICLVSTQLVAWTESSRMDVLCSMLLTCGTTIYGIDILKETTEVLSQQTPQHLQPLLDKAVREVSIVEGVLGCRSAVFWTLAEGHIIGTLHIRLVKDAKEQQVLRFIRRILDPLVTELTVQFELPNSAISPVNCCPVTGEGGGEAVVGDPQQQSFVAVGGEQSYPPLHHHPNYMFPSSTQPHHHHHHHEVNTTSTFQDHRVENVTVTPPFFPPAVQGGARISTVAVHADNSTTSHKTIPVFPKSPQSGNPPQFLMMPLDVHHHKNATAATTTVPLVGPTTTFPAPVRGSESTTLAPPPPPPLLINVPPNSTDTADGSATTVVKTMETPHKI